jgi:hypothetical protein
VSAEPLGQALERLRLVCPAFRPGGLLAQTGKCVLLAGSLDGQAAVAKCLLDPDPYWRARFAAEISWYRVFEQHPPPVRVPRLLFADAAQALSVLQALDGEPLGRARYAARPLPPDRAVALLAELERLHSWRPAQPPSSSQIAADYREKFQGYLARGVIGADDYASLDRLLDMPGPAPEFSHGDMLLSNCLALDSGLALIDWEFAGYYLPGYDLALLWALLHADELARRQIIETARRHGLAAERAFLVNQMRVLAREIKIHRKEGHSSGDERLGRLEADRDAVRVRLQAHLAR